MRIDSPFQMIPRKNPHKPDPRYHPDYPKERTWQNAVAGWFRNHYGGIIEPWLCYHTWTSINSEGGFPDLVCTHERLGKTLVAELKTETGELTEKQEGWLRGFAANLLIDVFLWRPSDTQEVIDYLQGCLDDYMGNYERG